MKRFAEILLATYLLMGFAFSSCSSAQGLSRPHGLGVRASFWNMDQHTMRFSVSGKQMTSEVDISGAGAWIHFFSHVYDNWFLQFQIGAVGSAKSKDVLIETAETDVSAVIPILIGFRYDLLSERFPSALQPYVAAGGGPYFLSSFRVNALSNEETVVGESKVRYGAYTGAGVNLMFASWAAFNFDIRYHFLEMSTAAEYSGLEFGLGLSLMWGKKREIFQIRSVKLNVENIYPVYYQFYNTYPLAWLTIRNTAGYDIEVNIRSSIKGFTERPMDTGFISIERGETKDIPVRAIFGKDLLNVHQREPAVLDLVVEARSGSSHRQQISAQLMIHHRNAWDGDVEKLRLYVSSDDAEMIRQSRQFISEQAIDGPEHVALARVVFEQLGAMGIHYFSDPNVPFYRDDRVQFADETLSSRQGDCDDLVVLYASLLESLGIKTAFVEVRDPEKELAHLYLLFDADLAPEAGNLVSSNEKRYLVRENHNGSKSIWVPVETTLVGKSFEEAWVSGASQYLEEAVLRGGLAEGWVKIVDIN